MSFFKNISIKVISVYLLLMITSIIFSIVIVFENQSDLIAENSRMKLEMKAGRLIQSLNRFSANLREDSTVRSNQKSETISEIIKIIESIEKRYLLLNKDDEIIGGSSGSLKLPVNYNKNKLKAIANSQFSGKEFYLDIDYKKMFVYFYIPIDLPEIENGVLLLSHDLEELKSAPDILYKQSFIIIMIMGIINIIFSIIHYRIVVTPVKTLHKVSQEISGGNFKARSNLRNNDEFGDLSRSINIMARSLKETIDNISEERDNAMKEKKEIEAIANKDELTGLYNRRYLFNNMEKEITKAIKNNTRVGFLMLDIDYFKKFNDTYGHQIGDKVLKITAQEIEKACRKKDIVARYGGEEFSIMFSDITQKQLNFFAEKIRNSIQNTKIESEKGVMKITVSIGGAIIDKDIMNASLKAHKSVQKVMNLMIYFADTALYLAKEKGRNRFEMG